MGEKHTFKVWLGRDNTYDRDYTLSKEHPVAVLSDYDTKEFAWVLKGYGVQLCNRGFQGTTGVRLNPGQIARCKVTVEVLEVWDCEYDEEAAEDYETRERSDGRGA